MHRIYVSLLKRNSEAGEADGGGGEKGGTALHFCRGNILCLF